MNTAARWGDLLVDGDARRREVRRRGANGLDTVEVREAGRRLLLTFLEHAPRGIGPDNVRIEAPPGGRPVRALDVRRHPDTDRELEDRLLVELDGPGSDGSYRLCLVAQLGDRPGREPLPGIDPRFAEATFRFNVDVPLAPGGAAPTGAEATGDEVSYLQRDYQGLRQLMLDRLAVTLPGFSETHAPDIWVTLVELLAYVGDDLSYYEDAVATEAYLQTARRRISVRRHGRLVDYRLHDGTAARTWVCVHVGADVRVPVSQLRFVAAGALGASTPVLDADAVSATTLNALTQFSPLPAALDPDDEGPEARWWPAHNTIGLWSWGESTARLAAGARSVVLVDGRTVSSPGAEPRRELHLAVGDVIVLEDLGTPSRLADPARRQAVRLTEIHRRFDELYGQPLLEVRWAPEDALAFQLTVTSAGRPCAQAVGNALLVGAGRPVQEAVDVTVPSPALSQALVSFATPFPAAAEVAAHQARRLRSVYDAWRSEIEDWLVQALEGRPLSAQRRKLLRGQLGDRLLAPLRLAEELGDAELEAWGLAELLARAGRLLARRRRRLEQLARLAETSGPLSDVLREEVADDWGPGPTAGLDPGSVGCWGPAAAAMTQDPRQALPVMSLIDPAGHGTWRPVADLIGVAPGVRAFVAEVDDQGAVHLRLNGEPQSTTLTARYWVGNGQTGNVEPEAINALVLSSGAALDQRPQLRGALNSVTGVRNPLPATGATAPEDAAAAKLAIPGAFLENQPRALTVEDYEAAAASVAGVRAAAAQLRSTGPDTVVEVAIAPATGEDPHAFLLHRVWRALEAERRIGHVLRIQPPRYRPLRVALEVNLGPSAIRATVADQLARLLSSGEQADGSPALFHPSRLAFAGIVYASPVIAAVHGVAGVRCAVLTALSFADATPIPGPPPDALALGALEIARCDNDPSAPEHGYAVVNLEGGR